MAAKHYPGIRKRHARGCPAGERGEDGKPQGVCRCEPSYEAFVYNKRLGRKVRKTFGSLAAARNWQADERKAIGEGKDVAPSKLTVEEAGEDWLARARRGEVKNRSQEPYKPSVLAGYEASLKAHVYPAVGHVRLAELRRPQVQALINKLEAGTPEKAALKPSTVRNAIMPLRVIIRQALADETLAVNVTTNLALRPSNGRRDRAATPEEAALLIEAVPEADRPIWATALYAGLRRGELRGLEWDDVDLEAGKIHVRRAYDQHSGQIVAPKTEAAVRTVPIAPQLRTILAAAKLKAPHGQRLAFPGAEGGPFDPWALARRARKAWTKMNAEREKKAKKQRGKFVPIAPIGLHECRHSYVTLMHAAGFSLEEIAPYVGHSASYVTERYKHLLEGREAADASKFGDYLTREQKARQKARRTAMDRAPVARQ
jgi:integrase